MTDVRRRGFSDHYGTQAAGLAGGSRVGGSRVNTEIRLITATGGGTTFVGGSGVTELATYSGNGSDLAGGFPNVRCPAAEDGNLPAGVWIVTAEMTVTYEEGGPGTTVPGLAVHTDDAGSIYPYFTGSSTTVVQTPAAVYSESAGDRYIICTPGITGSDTLATSDITITAVQIA